MGQVKIVTDTTCDLPQEFVDKYDVRLVPTIITLGDKTYKEFFELSPKQFYEYLANAPQRPQSAPPSRKDFSDVYTKLSQETDTILSIHLSPAWSPTHDLAVNMARFAIGAAQKQGKNLDVAVINSKTTSTGMAMIVIEAAQLAQQGKTKDEIIAHITPIIENLKSLFMVDDISYLEKSGRIGKAVSSVGSFLKVKPILSIEGGETSIKGVPFSSESGYDKMVKLMGEAIPYNSRIKLGFGHAIAPDKIAAFRARIEGKYEFVEIYETFMGPAVGATLGPGTFGCVYYAV